MTFFSLFYLSAVFYPSSCRFWNESQMVWSSFYEERMAKVATTVHHLVSFWFGVFSNPVCSVFIDSRSTGEKTEKKQTTKWVWNRSRQESSVFIDIYKPVLILASVAVGIVRVEDPCHENEIRIGESNKEGDNGPRKRANITEELSCYGKTVSLMFPRLLALETSFAFE